MNEPKKIAAFLPISEELLRPLNFEPMTDDEAADYRERQKQERLTIQNQHASTLAAADPFRRAILELHEPAFHGDTSSWARCDGCDFAGWEGEPPDWPCRTYELARDWRPE